jgi:CcmD family protein
MSLVNRIARTVALLLLVLGANAQAALAQAAPSAQAPPTTAAQEEYVPIDQLPEGEKLPAAPYLIAAYVVVWGALLLYVLTLWRRLGRVEAELREARRLVGSR